MQAQPNTIIESLGLYLPPRAVATSDVLRGCKRTIHFPLEHFTGIQSRRVAENESSLDLAVKAIADCLALSKYTAEDIDLVVCCNICRSRLPDAVSFEPSTAASLRAHFAFTSSTLTFDLSNACAGVFTGIFVVDCFLKSGCIRRGMVVSGEHITHLTRTAQRELKGSADPRLACLTLGDSGIAMILEQGKDDTRGFVAIELYTLGQYSKYCIAKASDRPLGGAIMLTDVAKLSTVALRHATAHAVAMQSRAGWPLEMLDHLIMHQTSERTIRQAANRVNALYGKRVCTPEKTVCNLRSRGNTATTSHFVAFHDHSVAGRIRPGHNVLFSVNASGLTIGTAAYICDDLPQRLRAHAGAGDNRRNGSTAARRFPDTPPRAAGRDTPVLGVQIESIGVISDQMPARAETIALSVEAAEACLGRSARDRDELDVLIYAGVYRSDFVSEPAIAAMIAGDLALSGARTDGATKRLLCFDVMSGAVGFLKACYIASRMIHSGRVTRAMIVTSEIEPNALHAERARLGVKQTGSALILERVPTGLATPSRHGFWGFFFRDFPEHLDMFSSHCDLSQPGGQLETCRDPRLERCFLDCLHATANAYLASEGVDRAEVRAVLAPQVSEPFLRELGDRIDLAEAMIYAGDGQDLYTSSLPHAADHALHHELVQPGDLALILSVGSGIQVGCALYQF